MVIQPTSFVQVFVQGQYHALATYFTTVGSAWSGPMQIAGGSSVYYYTAQDFEYDRAGVILGPDLVRRDGRWIARPEFCRDPGVKRADAVQFVDLIPNMHRVLLTCGMQGVVVYSTDPETRTFLDEMAG